MGSVGARLIFAVALFWGGVAQAGCAPDSVELRNESGILRFSVEVADNEAERSKGLMFRKKMPHSAGMLFVYSEAKHPYFWMKNTYLPLDMIFLDAAGRVRAVYSNAKPLDETPIDGGPGIEYVLEINAGLAHRMGISAQTVMRHPVMDQNRALWRCGQD